MAATERDHSLKAARSKALGYLSVRPRSVFEVKSYLKRKGVSDRTVEETVGTLLSEGHLDDRFFADWWATNGSDAGKGPRLIEHELAAKGVDREAVEAVLGGVENTQETVLTLARKRLDRMGKMDEERAYRRLSQYLIRRGFNPEVVHETCRTILREEYGRE